MRHVSRLLAGTTLAFLALPVIALIARAPWSSLTGQLETGWTPLVLSLLVSTAATLIALLFGLPLAWMLARAKGGWVRGVRGLLLVPIVLPPVVSGVALTAAFGRRGLLGTWLDSLGITLSFTTAGAIIAVLFVSSPLAVLAAEAGFRQVDPDFLDLGATLGLSAWERFRRIALPLAKVPIMAGAALTWARAIGEFGATITFAGNRPGITQTLPLAVFLGLERGIDQAVALSLLAVALAAVAAALTRLGWMSQ